MLERAAENSLWRNLFLRRDRARGWKSEGVPRCRPGEPLQSHRDHRAMSPRAGVGLLSGRLRWRLAGEGFSPAAGRRTVSRCAGEFRRAETTCLQRELASISGVAANSVRV